MKDCIILAAVRKGQSLDELNVKREELEKKYDAHISILSMPYVDISSTDIRERIAAGKSIRYMVKDVTLEYIDKHGLYR